MHYKVLLIYENLHLQPSLFAMKTPHQLQTIIRCWITAFMIGLVLSGVTAFSPETGLAWLCRQSPTPGNTIGNWLQLCYTALHDINTRYPYAVYAYDWLAFAHLVIAVAFIGPLMQPVRNKWVIQFGIIACCMIFPVAFIAGHIRSIPLFWQLIDCSFGVAGLAPLLVIQHKIRQLELAALQQA